MSENRCDYCGREVYLPFRCPYCGGKFCEEHRLPENHNCPSLRERRNVPTSSVVHSEQVIRAKVSRNNTEKYLLVLLVVLSLLVLVISYH